MDPRSLSAVMGNVPGVDYTAYLAGYAKAMRAANITNLNRAAMFAAQLGHESAGLRYMEEIADGSAYEGRTDLGNTQPGDGRRFKGRGPIQLTGRNNYRAFTRWANANGISAKNFENEPHLLSNPEFGFLAASYYWTVARPDINDLADRGDLEGVTRRINGGLNGIEDRRARYTRALALGNQLLDGGKTMEKVLDYSRDQVTQDTYYNCGPASSQTVIRAATGQLVPESELAQALRTTENGTDYIGYFPAVLNRYIPGAGYTYSDMPNDPATGAQVEKLWADIVRSIDAGNGLVANIVAPPNNYPRGVAPSTQSPRYAGGTVYHYIALMGYSDVGGRRVWVADSGFAPYGYWVSFDQLATLIPPKGYAYSTAQAKAAPSTQSKESDVDKAQADRIEQKLDDLLDQAVGVRESNGKRLFRGWAQLGDRTLVDAVAGIGAYLGLPGYRDTRKQIEPNKH